MISRRCSCCLYRNLLIIEVRELRLNYDLTAVHCMELIIQGGQRNVTQVLANSFFATLLCVVYFFLVGEDDHIWFSTSRLGSTEYLFRQHMAGLLWY